VSAGFALGAFLLSTAVVAAAEVPRPEHPRPDRVRAEWQTLNGTWEFDFDEADRGLAEGWFRGTRALSRTILVPYCPESRLSGIGDTSPHEVVWYRRSFTVPDAWRSRRLFLHFGAVDYEARVWVNGDEVGRHRGGMTPFGFDVTDHLKAGENVVVVRAWDGWNDRTLPRGKQYWKPRSESIFYTRTSGIWQTVWMERVPRSWLRRLRWTPNLERWEIDFESVDAAPARTRALVIVSPNNPTGSFVSARELSRLFALCCDRGWVLIADEVFAEYPLDADAPVTDIAARADVPCFTLGGLSKSAGLPQLKLGWIVAGGPEAACAAALAGLELIADSFLSVSTPVQVAAPHLLERGAAIRAQIHERARTNLAALRALATSFPACEALTIEGGWSAVVRVPATRSEEQLILELLDREGILVHPGYFFDFPREAFLVMSLLPPPDMFSDAAARVLRVAVS